jgi:hypothetical protein
MSHSDQALAGDRLDPQVQEGGQVMSDGVKILLGALDGAMVAPLLVVWIVNRTQRRQV